MNDIISNAIVFMCFGLMCVCCYRTGLMDGKEYMLDIFNEVPEEEKDERCDR